MSDLFENDEEDDVRWEDGEGESLAGRVLVAMPGIGAPRFQRTVILMCAHSPDYAMGIAIKRPLEGLSLPDLLDRLGVPSRIEVPEKPVLVGGPVERERGFVVHTDDYTAPDATLPVGDGISLTATRDVLEAMAGQGEGPRCAILALGCAGWSPGQLEREIKENVWLTCDADEDLIFDDEHDTKWARALAKMGVSAGHLSGQAGRA